MRRLLAAGVCLAVLASPILTCAVTVHVPVDQPTIQDGINAASSGDTVLVACGTYHEHDIVAKSGIVLIGETGEPGCVDLDVAGQGRGLYCADLDSLTRVQGLRICNASAGGVFCARSRLALSAVEMVANYAEGGGAGIYCRDQSFLQLSDCLFQANTTLGGGGGVWCYGDCTLTMVDCQFVGNVAGANGGGVYCAWSSFSLVSCDFIGNTTHESAGGMDAQHCQSSALTRCSFVYNAADRDAGGLKYNHSVLTLEECLFSVNSAVWSGGGLFSDFESSTTITTSAFVGNEAQGSGGAIYNSLSDLHLLNVTLSGNSCGQVGGGVFCRDHGAATMSSCILAFATAGEAVYCDDTSTATAACADVFGNDGGDWIGCIADQCGLNGNISEDPLFCDPENSNYTIDETSPCAPANNSCGVLMGAYGVGCGVSAIQTTSWGVIKAMWRRSSGGGRP